MKKLLVSLFVFGFLFVGFQVHAEVSTPTLTVLSPNNGSESVEVGGKIEIRWMSPNISLASIEVYISDGTHKGHTESVKMENNIGSVIYTLDSNLIPGSNYKAYISTAYGSAVSVSDSSDNTFTINSPAATITLESNPQASNGTVTIKLGDAITFIGFPNNLTGQNGVDYTMSFNFDPIFDGVCNQDGIHVLSQKCIPTQTGTGTFSIQVTQNGHVYNSNVIRVIVTPKTINSATPSITVTSPNGGEVYKEGQQITVKWKSENLPSDAKIRVILSAPYDLISSYNPSTYYVSNTGSTTFTLPTESDFIKGHPSPWGKNFQFVVSTPMPNSTGALALDLTNNKFSINKSTNTVATTPIKRTLRKGTKGDDVKILQLFLNLVADGSFGPKTQAKVMEWQAAHGLTADGSFGPMSRQKAGLAQ